VLDREAGNRQLQELIKAILQRMETRTAEAPR
jgi:hypothetical protein